MKNKETVLNSVIIIDPPAHARQEQGLQAVIYQPDVKKSKLFPKAPKKRHNGFMLFNSGPLGNFTLVSQPGALD
jgi:hypothetical protein